MTGSALNAAVSFRRFTSASELTAALTAASAGILHGALASRGQASLVVPGGRTPAPWFQALRAVDLDWPTVTVTLGDERWVPPLDAASNEHLVRGELLRDHAATARFIGLKNEARTAEAGAAQAWKALATITRPFDLTVLGMGEDGHFASLFPQDPRSRPGLDLAQPPACIAVSAPVPPYERLSLNLSALLQSRQLILLVTGERKWTLLEQQLNQSVPALPVRALLRQPLVPLTVYWSP